MSPEDLLADLPPVRDDEPSSLRQDIADELADHLECAVRREQMKSNGADDVERRVLERFGNPRQISRRLWWLAMWSRIMSQRVLLGVSLAGNVAAVLLCVAVFWQVGRERELSIERAVLAQSLADQREELVAQQSDLKAQLAVMAVALEQVRQRAATSAMPPGEPTLRVRLEGPEQGSPLPESAQVSIKGLQLRNQALERTNGVSRERPEVDFGRVVSGGYRIQVGVGPYKYSEEISLADGETRELVICCPGFGPEVRPTFDRELPEDLQARGIVPYAEYELLPVEVAGNRWERVPSERGRSRGFNRDRSSFLTLLGIETKLDDGDHRNVFRMPSWSDQDGGSFNPFDPFLSAVVRFASGEATPYASSESAYSGMRVQLTRLVLVDDVYPLSDDKRQSSRGLRVGEGEPQQRWAPAVLVFDADRLQQFPSLVEPVVLTAEPMRLTLPQELLTLIRTTLARVDAADAAIPANFLRSSTYRREDIRSLLLARRKVFRP